MLAAAAGAHVEHCDRRPNPAAVGKQVIAMGQLYHAHRDLIGVQYRQRQRLPLIGAASGYYLAR